jgi:hypothetical protein
MVALCHRRFADPVFTQVSGLRMAGEPRRSPDRVVMALWMACGWPVDGWPLFAWIVDRHIRRARPSLPCGAASGIVVKS